MNAVSSEPASLPPGIERGKKYRFSVRDAEEAISTLKRRLGSEAKVISVKQLEGHGLSRFLQSPKLEIIAWIPPVDHEEVTNDAATPDPEARVENQLPDLAAEVSEDIDEDALLEEEVHTENGPFKGTIRATYGRTAKSKGRGSDVWSVLRRAGFSDSLIHSLGNESHLESLPLAHAMAEINRRLREQYAAIPQKPLTQRIAFFGTPGVGKTTALCKRIASEVFLAQQEVQVLKLDGDSPNPDDALSLYCDVVGVPLLRDPIEPEQLPDTGALYVDLPGVPVREREQWLDLRLRLDQLGIESRVLVIHGLFAGDLINEAFDLGARMGATHLVITHVDELSTATKLWPFILRSGLTPLFASHGQNVTGDYSTDVLRIMLEKTFPSTLIQ